MSLALRQGGRVTRAQLRALGLSDRQVDRQLAAGRLTRRFPGVFTVGAVAPSDTGRAWEAVLAVGGDAMLAATWGCWWHGLLPGPAGPVDVATTSQAGRKLAGIRVHRRQVIGEADVRVVDGLRTASPALCLLGLGRVRPGSLPRALNEAQRRLVDVGDLRTLAWGRPGSRALIAAMDAYDLGEARTREELERRALAMLVAHGAPRYEPNARVATAVREYEVDGLYREQRLVVELQSEAHHATPAERRADRAKANALVAAGFRLLQWDWHDVTREPRTTVARLLDVLAAASRRADGA